MMGDIKWIKIVTDIFSDEKILLIESMPDADTIIVIWFKLLCLAGIQNRCGIVTLKDQIPYTDDMLSAIMRRPVTTVRLALDTFEHFGMIERVDGVIAITNWDKHQNVEGMEKVREQNRIRKQCQRERQKALLEDNHVTSRDCHVTVTQQNKNKNKNKEKDISICVDYQQIVDAYNETCVSLPHVTKLTDKRKRAIKSALSDFSIDEIKDCFSRAERSDFLTGKSKDWKAGFDWLINKANIVKVLEGNYDNSKKTFNKSKNTFNDYQQAGTDYDALLEQIKIN